MMLYGAPYPAPNPRRVRMYLAEKRLTVPYTDLSLPDREIKEPFFLAKNSLGQVPALELDDGTVIAESVAICRYFEALHPEPSLFGTNGKEQALVDMWIRRIEFQLTEPLYNFWRHAHPRTAAAAGHPFKAFGEAQRERVIDRMDWLNGEISGRPFIVGDHFTMADVMAECAIGFASWLDIRIPAKAAALAAWRARIKARPSYKA